MHIPVWSIFHISSSWVCFRFNLLQFFFEQTPIVRTIFRTKFYVPCTRSHSVRISPIKRVFRSSKNFSSGRRADTVCSLPSSRGNFFLLQFNQNIWGSNTLNIQTTPTRVPAYFQSFTLKCVDRFAFFYDEGVTLLLLAPRALYFVGRQLLEPAENSIWYPAEIINISHK